MDRSDAMIIIGGNLECFRGRGPYKKVFKSERQIIETFFTLTLENMWNTMSILGVTMVLHAGCHPC